MRRIEKLWRILRVPSYRNALLRHGVAAAVEHETVLGALDFGTVVDVGANRGQFSLVALHRYPRATIISIEPLSEPARRFRRVFAAEHRVTLHNAALGPVSGDATMHVSAHDDSSSLLPISAAQEAMFRGTGEVRTETVEVAPLSQLLNGRPIDGPALLKLDVQGYELEALRSCEDVLGSFDYICAEGSFVELYRGQVLADELIAWLRARDYELVCAYGIVGDEQGRAVQADMLFTRRRS